MSSVRSDSKLAFKIQSLGSLKPTSMSTNNKSSLIIGSKDGFFNSHNLQNLVQEKSIKTDLSSIECLIIDSNDTIWLGSDSGEIQSYSDSSSDKISLKGHDESIVSLHIDSSEQFLYSTSEDCTVRKWNLLSLENEILFNANDSIISADFNETLQKLELSTSSGMLYLLSINESLDVLSLKIDSKVWCIKLSEIRNFSLEGNNDGELIVRNLSDLQVASTMTGHESRIKNVELSTDHKFAVTGSFDQKIIVWNLEKFEIKNYLEGPNDWIKGVIIGPQDTNIYSVSDDSRLYMWNIMINNEEEKENEIKDSGSEIKDSGSEIEDSGSEIKEFVNEIKESGIEIKESRNDKVQVVEKAVEGEIRKDMNIDRKDMKVDRKDDNDSGIGKDRKIDRYVVSSLDRDREQIQDSSLFWIYFSWILSFVIKLAHVDKLIFIFEIISFKKFVESIIEIKELIFDAILSVSLYFMRGIGECLKSFWCFVLNIIFLIMRAFLIPLLIILSIPAVSLIFLKKLIKRCF